MLDRESFSAEEVFTPTTPARATFVERSTVNDRLVDALRTPGKQIVIYGHSGSGKTTLLVNKLHQTYEKHITTRCTSQMSFDSILLSAFDELAPFVTSEELRRQGSTRSASLSSEYLGIKAQVGSTETSEVQSRDIRILPPQLTLQALAHFLGETNCCWVLEDFHKVTADQKVHLSQAMKLFMDMADEYRGLKIIAIGAVDAAREVVSYDPEMRNRVSEIHVPLMEPAEIEEIVDKGESLLNFTMAETVKQGIVSYSNGLASACHQLCLNICHSAGIQSTLGGPAEITNDELEKALEMYMADASDTLKAAFDSALRQKRKRHYDNGRLILRALADSPSAGATSPELLQKIRRDNPSYPAGNLARYTAELQQAERGELIRRDAASGRCFFADPIYRVYAQALFRQHKAAGASSGLVVSLEKEDFDVALKLLKASLTAMASESTPN